MTMTNKEVAELLVKEKRSFTRDEVIELVERAFGMGKAKEALESTKTTKRYVGMMHATTEAVMEDAYEIGLQEGFER